MAGTTLKSALRLVEGNGRSGPINGMTPANTAAMHTGQLSESQTVMLAHNNISWTLDDMICMVGAVSNKDHCVLFKGIDVGTPVL